MKWKAPKSGKFNMAVLPDINPTILALAFSHPGKDEKADVRKRVENARRLVYEELCAASALKNVPFAQLMQALVTDHQLDSAATREQFVTNTVKMLGKSLSMKRSNGTSKAKEIDNVAEAAV